MSIDSKIELQQIAKTICRDLRRNSTKAENILWEELRTKKFYGKKFFRQYAIYYDLTGRESFFIADFYCHEEKLVIEIDGTIHKFRLTADKERTEILNLLGLRVIRFKNEEVINNLNSVLENIKNVIDINT